MKKMVLKEWEDRGISKVKVSFMKEDEGMKEFIVPKESLGNFLTENKWF